MRFEEWMSHKGLSASTRKKYEDALRGVMSDWAIENSITAGTLTAIVDHIAFNSVARQIRRLPIYKQRNKRGHGMYDAALKKYSEYLLKGHSNTIESDIDEILSTTIISETEKANLIKSRIGQGVFRQKLVSKWNGCSVTGFKDTNLLIASHIKPWRASNNHERLDPFNGLLLTPNLDKVFDAGLITFDQAGKILVSPLLTEAEKIGISAQLCVTLAPQHEPYMEFHRTKVFRPD